MKTRFITLLTLLMCLSAFAQRPSKEKLKALKIAHITEQLDLSEKEAQAFWPIYNEHEEARAKLQDASNTLRKKEDIDNFSETEAKNFIANIIKMEEERLKLNKAYHSKLIKVIPAKKIIALIQTERSFRKKMIEEFKERHRDNRQERKRN